MQDVTVQVSEAVELVNQTLDVAFPFILVEGEVSSFKVNQDKFVFFDIKDEAASIGCFMMVFNLKFPLEDGMRVKILAQPKLTQWGKFSLTVREVMPIGEGSLKKSLELLKTKLDSEGLFDQSRKRVLPKIPQRIGVISSSQAAGYADFIKILDNRWGGLEIVLVDVAVQGIEAPEQLIGALGYLNELADPLDVIAVIRGGGSADDLSAFNHEALVRAIAASRTPTIVGVGHEVDVSLADLAADVRAATPSNAAELLVPDKSDLLQRVERIKTTAYNGIDAAVRVFEQDRMSAVEAVDRALSTLLMQKDRDLELVQQTLRQISPDTVLKRGYAIVRGADGVVSRVENVTIQDELSVQLKDGQLKVKVSDVKRS